VVVGLGFCLFVGGWLGWCFCVVVFVVVSLHTPALALKIVGGMGRLGLSFGWGQVSGAFDGLIAMKGQTIK
jgi:hypothetical protein